MKKIIMIKSVFDDTEAQELEESFNPVTVALTDALFGEAHPFGSKLRKKVSVEDIAKRRMRFALYKIDKAEEATQIFSISLEVIMKNWPFSESSHDQMQDLYINGKLAEFFNEQHFNVPTKDAEETECFLNYLAQFVPEVWDYFKVV